MKISVIAMAYDGSPVIRSVVGSAERVIYLSKENAELSADRPGFGVGFPREFVYELDPQLFEALQAAHQSGDENRLLGLWKTARRFEAE